MNFSLSDGLFLYSSMVTDAGLSSADVSPLSVLTDDKDSKVTGMVLEEYAVSLGAPAPFRLSAFKSEAAAKAKALSFPIILSDTVAVDCTGEKYAK